MSLLIENQQNILYVKGEINQSNSEVFKNHIQSYFSENKDVVININEVSCIDRYGFNVLTSLYQTSLQKEKSFFIIGYGCKEIYDELLLTA